MTPYLIALLSGLTALVLPDALVGFCRWKARQK